MKRHIVTIALSAAAGGAFAQAYTLEGAVIDSRDSKNLGVVNESGQLDSVFRAQKAMTFGILRAAGIPLDRLSPEVRARIERFQTTNIEAFRAFSQGLDLKDQGKFVEAKEYFKRAAELDPGFALAAEQQRSMPDVNLGSNVQTRALVIAAAGAAVDRGRATYVVDAAHAVAAIAAGQTVVVTTVTPSEQALAAASGYTSNPPGSSAQYLPNLVAGVAYSYISNGSVVNLANAVEWTADKYQVANGVLQSVGSAGDFLAQRQGAVAVPVGSAMLSDGTTAYWGAWLSAPGASAIVTVSGVPQMAPALGEVDYVYANATPAMPTSGTAVFTPAGGSLANASGAISVNFVTRNVALQNLGFSIGNLDFSGLSGSALYSNTIASGTFSGNYSAGNCNACPAFTPQGSSFGGSFVGNNASGLVFSTFLLTGNGGTASGVHLFKGP